MTAFQSQIRKASTRAGSVAKLAILIGIPKRTLEKYALGETEPDEFKQRAILSAIENAMQEA